MLEDFLVAAVVVAVLIALNGLYVAAEFAAVSARKTRLESEGDAEDPRVAWLISTIDSSQALDAYVATAQVGITVSSLTLGLFGQSYIAPICAALLARADLGVEAAAPLSVAVTLLFLTSTQVILGELVPKSMGISSPERVALLTSRFMRFSLRVFSPLIWVFNGSSAILLKMFGADLSHGERDVAKTAEDIRLMAHESRTGGVLDEVSYRLLDNALRLRGLNAGQVMIPRRQILAFEESMPLKEALRELANSPHSRAPVYRKSLDEVLGLVHIKDLFEGARQRPESSLSDHLRPLPVVPETIGVRRLFWQLQNERFHMAVLIDEYGGTAGLLTLEDLIERIVGSIKDEYDPPEEPIMSVRGDRVELLGLIPLVDLNDRLGLALVAEESYTLSGMLIERFRGFPEVGAVVECDGFEFRVEETDGRRVVKASLELTAGLAAHLHRDKGGL